MKIAERLSTLGVVAFAVGVLALLYAPMAALSPAMAQQTTTNTTSPEAAPEDEAAMTEEQGHESGSNETHEDTFTGTGLCFRITCRPNNSSEWFYTPI